ncbi:MAG TPA: 3-oxoacyl-ACP reductase FabG [Chitinophagaceae bacterium]|nr:3-oxoacyl-ACP reductase FabG [Chitinophagaceae bacterium]
MEEKPIALITGASRGIGRSIAVALAAQNYHVLINYQSNLKAAEETLAMIENQNGTGTLLPFDVGDKNAVRTAIENWEKENPQKHISVLINNAGIKKDTLLAFMEDDDWENVIDTNLNGMYWVTKAVITNMILNRKGKIVNIASLSGVQGMAGQINYASAKGGMIAATKSLAQELGARNITVNAVAPGFITTDMTEDLDEKSLKKNIPLRRFGTAQEVADAVLFLISEKANYITGQVLQVNGGLYM